MRRNLISTPLQQGVGGDDRGETVSTVSTEWRKPFKRVSPRTPCFTALKRGANERDFEERRSPKFTRIGLRSELAGRVVPLRRRIAVALLATALLGLAASSLAAALDEPRAAIAAPNPPASPEASATEEDEAEWFFNTQQYWDMDHLLPEHWLKPLSDRGIDYMLMYTSDVLGNVNGGLKRETAYSGVLEAGVELDTEKLFGWRGATIYASGMLAHGRSLSDDRFDELYGISRYEQDFSVRLYELWLDQSFCDEAVSLRVGQLALDREFLGTDVGVLFMNSAFGWPTAFEWSMDAATYPVAAPGARLRIDLGRFWFQTAVFTGETESVEGRDEPSNEYGVDFNFGGGLLAIWEVGYATVTEEVTSRHPGVYKLGGWLHTGDFVDQRYDDEGLSLADPVSNENSRILKNNWGLYAVAEQNIWNPSPDMTERGLSLFARVAAVPADRNLISCTLDAGLHYVGLLPGRPRDVTGVGFSYSRISNRVRDLARDENLYYYADAPLPLPDYQAVLEWTYRIEIRPWWYLQPDLQYIMHPGGSSALQDALVIGLRSTLSF